jgi:hypothetical protein
MDINTIITMHAGVAKVVSRLKDYLGGENVLVHNGISLYQKIVLNACIAWTQSEHDAVEDQYRSFLFAVAEQLHEVTNYTVMAKETSKDNVEYWDCTSEPLTEFMTRILSTRRYGRKVEISYQKIETLIDPTSLFWLLSRNIFDRTTYNAVGLPLPGSVKVYSLKNILMDELNE